MHALRRALVWILGSIIVLLVTARLLLATPPVQRWIGDRVEAFVGPALVLGEVEPSFRPVLGLRIGGVDLVDPAAPDSKSAARIEEVRVAIAPRPLLDAEFEIESLVASGTKLRIEPGPQGETTLAGAIASIGERFGGDDEAPPPDGPPPAADDSPPKPFRLPLSLHGFEAEIVRADGAPLTIGLRSLDAELVFGHPDAAIRVEVDAKPGDQGRIRALVLYGVGGVEDAIDAHVAIETVPASEFLSQPVGGFETYAANLDVAGRLGTATRAPDLRGHGHIDFRGGDLGDSNLADLIFEALLSITPEGDEQPDEPKRPARIEALTADLEIAEGAVSIQDLSFDTDDFQVEGSGRISFDLEVLLDLRVALTTEGVARLLTSARLPIPEEIGKLPPTPIRIHGRGDDLSARPLIRAIPLAAAGYAVDTAVGAGKGLIDRALSLFGVGDEQAEGESDEHDGDAGDGAEAPATPDPPDAPPRAE